MQELGFQFSPSVPCSPSRERNDPFGRTLALRPERCFENFFSRPERPERLTHRSDGGGRVSSLPESGSPYQFGGAIGRSMEVARRLPRTAESANRILLYGRSHRCRVISSGNASPRSPREPRAWRVYDPEAQLRKPVRASPERAGSGSTTVVVPQKVRAPSKLPPVRFATSTRKRNAYGRTAADTAITRRGSAPSASPTSAPSIVPDSGKDPNPPPTPNPASLTHGKKPSCCRTTGPGPAADRLEPPELARFAAAKCARARGALGRRFLLHRQRRPPAADRTSTCMRRAGRGSCGPPARKPKAGAGIGGPPTGSITGRPRGACASAARAESGRDSGMRDLSEIEPIYTRTRARRVRPREKGRRDFSKPETPCRVLRPEKPGATLRSHRTTANPSFSARSETSSPSLLPVLRLSRDRASTPTPSKPGSKPTRRGVYARAADACRRKPLEEESLARRPIHILSCLSRSYRRGEAAPGGPGSSKRAVQMAPSIRTTSSSSAALRQQPGACPPGEPRWQTSTPSALEPEGMAAPRRRQASGWAPGRLAASLAAGRLASEPRPKALRALRPPPAAPLLAQPIAPSSSFVRRANRGGRRKHPAERRPRRRRPPDRERPPRRARPPDREAQRLRQSRNRGRRGRLDPPRRGQAGLRARAHRASGRVLDFSPSLSRLNGFSPDPQVRQSTILKRNPLQTKTL